MAYSVFSSWKFVVAIIIIANKYNSNNTQRLIPIKVRSAVATMCRLGMEMVPAKLNDAEREYAKRAIAEYKTIRPIVQQGDLYRLISPYEGDKNHTALMYVNEAKDRAVLFAYRHLMKEAMSAHTVSLSFSIRISWRIPGYSLARTSRYPISRIKRTASSS